MSTSHGDAIITENISDHRTMRGDVYAYEDAHIARHVPEGYFVEQRGSLWLAGSSTRGYATEPWNSPNVPDGQMLLCRWRDWYDAVCWCRHDARQKRGAA